MRNVGKYYIKLLVDFTSILLHDAPFRLNILTFCFRAVAIKVVDKLFHHPSFNTLDREIFFAQNLPSTLVSHNLGPRPGDVLLDMCAAPGMIRYLPE